MDVLSELGVLVMVLDDIVCVRIVFDKWVILKVKDVDVRFDSAMDGAFMYLSEVW